MSTQTPSWIEDLLHSQPYSCSEPAYVHLRQGLVRERISAYVATSDNGSEQLRTACRERLTDDDAALVERALTCLFVVGVAEDASAVEPLLTHAEEAVRKAARTCLFEIRRRRS
jgi:hypothetical protein